MEQSESINELVAALVKARPNFKPFTKDQTAKVTSQKGSYTYQYGDKASLFDAVMPALNAEGLVLMQGPEVHDGKPVLVTELAHQSGQWKRWRMPIHLFDRPQDTGSELTYLSRYAAQLALGVAGEADDDGASAQQGQHRPQPQAASKASAPPSAPMPTRTDAVPVARPSARPSATPTAKPNGKAAFVAALEKAASDPFDDVPHPADLA